MGTHEHPTSASEESPVPKSRVRQHNVCKNLEDIEWQLLQTSRYFTSKLGNVSEWKVHHQPKERPTFNKTTSSPSRHKFWQPYSPINKCTQRPQQHPRLCVILSSSSLPRVCKEYGWGRVISTALQTSSELALLGWPLRTVALLGGESSDMQYSLKLLSQTVGRDAVAASAIGQICFP